MHGKVKDSVPYHFNLYYFNIGQSKIPSKYHKYLNGYHGIYCERVTLTLRDSNGNDAI